MKFPCRRRPQPCRRRPQPASVAFGLLGFACSWTLSDTVYANLAAFMPCLPSGLELADNLGIGAQCFQALVLALWWCYTCKHTPSRQVYVRLIYAALAAEILAALLIAAAWRATVGDVAIVLILAEGTAAAIGALSWAVTLPFIATHYSEHTVSAFFTGSTSGSLVAGVLGLVQGAAPRAFSPTPCMLTLAVLLLPSVAAAVWIFRQHPEQLYMDGGRGGESGSPPDGDVSSRCGAGHELRSERREAVAPLAAAKSQDLPAPAGAGPGPGPGPGAGPGMARVASPSATASQSGQLVPWLRDRPERVPPWVVPSMPLWGIAVPMNAATWGATPLLSNFAACVSPDPLRLTSYMHPFLVRPQSVALPASQSLNLWMTPALSPPSPAERMPAAAAILQTRQ